MPITISIASRSNRFSRMKPNMMQNLRERGIYSLSDGREFVVHAVFRGGYVFYTPEDWDFFGPHAFESDAEGHLRWSGQSNRSEERRVGKECRSRWSLKHTK